MIIFQEPIKDKAQLDGHLRSFSFVHFEILSSPFLQLVIDPTFSLSPLSLSMCVCVRACVCVCVRRE